MLDLVKLKTFQIVAATGSLTRAAVKLGYSQSNVTTHIKALELELGRTLFDRNRMGVALTDSGRRALDYAGRLLTLEAEAKALIHEPELPSGTLRISAPECLLSYRLPELFHEYRRKFPHVHISVISTPGVDAHIASVLTRTADLALILDTTLKTDRLNVEGLGAEEIVAVVAPNHALLNIPANMLQAHLETETLLCDVLHVYHLVHCPWATRRAHNVVTLELGSIDAVKHCAMTGMGFALLPLFAVREELEQGKLARLPKPTGIEIGVEVQMLSPKEHLPLPATEEFCFLARKLLVGR